MRAQGKWGGQSKMPRCRSDREIADELAKLAQRSSDKVFSPPPAACLARAVLFLWTTSAHAEILG
jgi:hypothetical protein